jgi:hypothetical protein
VRDDHQRSPSRIAGELVGHPRLVGHDDDDGTNTIRPPAAAADDDDNDDDDDEEEEELEEDEEHTDHDRDIDPPPVPFECDGFLLLAPTTDEYLMLNDESGEFVHGSGLLRMQEEEVEDGRRTAGTAPKRPLNQQQPEDDDAAAASKGCCVRDVLVPASRHPHEGNARDNNNNTNNDNDDDGIQADEVVHIGIECKHVVVPAATASLIGSVLDGAVASCHPRIGATVAAVGRQLVREDRAVPGADASVTTEVRSWERKYTYTTCTGTGTCATDPPPYVRTFTSPRICRFRNHFFTMELDAKCHRLLVVFMKDHDERGDNEFGGGGGAAAPRRRAVANEDEPLPPPDDEDDDPHASGSRFIHVLPFVDIKDENRNSDAESDGPAALGSSTQCLSLPVAKIDCKDGITSLSSSGYVWAVSTVTNKLLWYDRAQLVHTYSIVDCVREALAASSSEAGVGAGGAHPNSSHPAPKRSVEREQLILQSLSKATAIETIRFAPFVEPDRAGFVTLSHGESTGSTVLLWKKCSPSDLYKVDAVVRLPLRASRIPKVHFDGRRLLVYGEDHMGHILLVYVVQSLDDGDDFGAPGSSTASGGGGAAGIIVPGSLRFARRVRHDAMGGLSEFDSLHVSANERFIVVNTRTGHQLNAGRRNRRRSTSSASPADGLLVIDVAKAD